MKIRALRLAEVGPFSDPVAVEDFSGALDVLAGPNELGKSTLFRAIRAVFLTRHTTTGRAVEEISTRGGTRSPRIEADFEAQGQLWRIRKTFGRGKSADLVDLGAGRVRARGADAEEALGGLIGLTGGDEAGGRFGLLWVGQQKSLIVPTPDYDPERRKFSGRSERATLEGAIASEVDTVAGGALARRIADRVTAELDAYLQPKRRLPRKGSRYEAASQQRFALIAKREHARAEQVRAAARLDRLEELMRRQAAQAGPDLLAGLRRAKDMAEKSLSDAEKLANALDHALSRADAAHLAHEKAAERLQKFGKALDDVRAASAETARLNEEQARSEAARQERSEELAAIDRQIGTVEARMAQLAREAERVREAAALRKSIAFQEAAQLRADELCREIARIEAAVLENAATPERMRQLAEAVQAAALAAERAARPAAVDFGFALEAAASHRVQINGEPVSGAGRIGVVETVTIEIEGIGRFEITPADAAERIARRAEAEAAQSRLASLEAELGARAGEAAQALADDRHVLAEALMRAKAELQAAAPEGVAAIGRKLEADRQALVALVHPGNGDAPHDAGGGQTPVENAGLAGAALDAEELQRLLSVEVGALRARRDEVMNALREYDFALRRIADRRTDIAERLAVCDAMLGPEAGRMGERDRLAALSDAAAAAWTSAVQERTLLSQSAPSGEQVSALRDGKAAAEDALRQAEASATRLAQEIAALEGEIRVAGEAEIGPELTSLDGEIAALDAEIAHYERELEALELLQQTLAAVAAENRSRFLLPVMSRLRPYLAQVFPDADVVLGDDFDLQSLTRGGTGEPIDLLSDGTREQLAVLVRLGFGRLIAETGTPAPVILDDALVFSDDQRIVRMFGALQSASQHHQVIIFTCRETTFGPLGGTRLKLTPWERDA